MGYLLLKNVYLKKLLKGTIFNLITLVNKVVPKKDEYILLYSANKGIEFNLKPLKEYLINNGYCEKNRVFCGVENMSYSECDTNSVKYINHIKSCFVFLRTKHVFYTTGQIPIKPSKSQIVIHLQHGTTFKNCGALTNINNGDEFFFTYCMATSELYKPIYAKAFGCKEENVVVNSEPVTDIFYANRKKYDFGDFNKVILWTPTFRQSDYLGYSDSSSEELLLIFKEQDYEQLNETLRKYNFLLMVKIHPSQDLSRYKNLNFSNLKILSSTDFQEKNYELYELLPQIDMLIADYSSLFLQYLMLDKPVSFVIPDFNDYKEKRGFVFNDPLAFMPGEKIYGQQDFYDMLKNLYVGNDNYKEDRESVIEKVHEYRDGNSCERLIQISKIK